MFSKKRMTLQIMSDKNVMVVCFSGKYKNKTPPDYSLVDYSIRVYIRNEKTNYTVKQMQLCIFLYSTAHYCTLPVFV